MDACVFFTGWAGRRPAVAVVRGLALAVASVGWLWAMPANADSVYKWVDADGVTHISSSRPAGDIKRRWPGLLGSAPQRLRGRRPARDQRHAKKTHGRATRPA